MASGGRVEPRHQRDALVLGYGRRPIRRAGARASPARSTCRAPAPTGRSRASSPPTKEGALYPRALGPPQQIGLPRVPGRRRVAHRGVARRRGDRGVDRGAARQPAADPAARTVRRFGAPLQGGRCAAGPTGPLRRAVDARLGGRGLRPLAGRPRAARGAQQARPVRRRCRSLLAARRAPAAAVRADRRRPARGAGARGRLAVARRGARRIRRAADPDRAGPTSPSRTARWNRCPSPASASAGAAPARCSTASTTRWPSG